MRCAKLALLSSLLLPLTLTYPANARDYDDDDEEEVSDDDESPGETEGADVRTEDEDGNTESKKELDPGEIEKAKEAEKANSPIEDPNKNYYFVGLRYRYMYMPQFMMNLFADGGTSLGAHGFGPEFTARKDNFEYVLSAWWAGYDMPYTRFKAAGDPPGGWEYVKANMNLLYLTADFNWTSQITPVFGLNLGLGAGFGFAWGDIIRTEAYKDNNGKWGRCTADGAPGDTYTYKGETSQYCDGGSDAQYNYNEPSWAGGGSKPIVFPWLALQTGVRIKPHRNVMLRVDLGWAIVGPFFGISGNYGI